MFEKSFSQSARPGLQHILPKFVERVCEIIPENYDVPLMKAVLICIQIRTVCRIINV